MPRSNRPVVVTRIPEDAGGPLAGKVALLYHFVRGGIKAEVGSQTLILPLDIVPGKAKQALYARDAKSHGANAPKEQHHAS